ncbi:COP9 signalosome subunit CsnD [Arthroderma uncinatum]|uniref:COP9 signalosome subunit CsnD n=1 Tax=Arthroderma uncinatum TaxID=74035 RepID=UPI00144AEF9E|nr:COP9 signalosome subunit CsnD [Arthroderma uncinatum]KAF3480831.1 COP9 signalosome subunit CsnD [Arthroderma uncinatum]
MDSSSSAPEADSEFAAEFAEIEAAKDQRTKAQLYSDLLSKIVNKSSSSLAQNLIIFLGSLLSGNISIIASRPLLDSFITSLKPLPASTRIEVGLPAIIALQSRSTSVEEQDAHLRETLADAYEEVEEYSQAARVLQAIHLDSSQRHISDEEKIRMWIRIIRLYLEDDDAGGAEMFLNKIKNLPTKTEDPVLRLHFQLSQARILDARRRFLEASQEYLAVSLASGVDEEDRLQALSAAIRCVVLAPAGPQRSRALSRLYKDDRSSSLEEYSILEKIFRDQLLTEDEVTTFAAGLVPHQLAQTADGLTVLDKAVIEHNLLAASRLYENIRVEDLGLVLGLKATDDVTAGEKAEAYAARMLEQGRLKGTIDQIDGVISFDSEADGDGRTGRNLRHWDAGVQTLAEDVENVAAAIMDEFPEFSAAQLVH